MVGVSACFSILLSMCLYVFMYLRFPFRQRCGCHILPLQLVLPTPTPPCFNGPTDTSSKNICDRKKCRADLCEPSWICLYKLYTTSRPKKLVWLSHSLSAARSYLSNSQCHLEVVSSPGQTWALIQVLMPQFAVINSKHLKIFKCQSRSSTLEDQTWPHLKVKTKQLKAFRMPGLQSAVFSI